MPPLKKLDSVGTNSRQVWFTPAEAKQFFGVSKNTLIRWDGSLLPPVERVHGVRRFRGEDIYNVVRKRMLSRFYRDAANDLLRAAEVLEESALLKFLSGNLIGLRELAELKYVSQRTIVLLIQIAPRRYKPIDPEFAEILRIAFIHSRRAGRAG